MEVKTHVLNAVSNNNLFLLNDLFHRLQKTTINEIVSSKYEDTTLLLIAARYGYDKVMQYLIKFCGADIEQTGKVEIDEEIILDAPPLWCAAAAGHLNCVKLLIKHGANVNSTSRSNSSPLRAACYDGHFEIVKLLVEKGADIELANKHGHTCLMISCYKGHLNIATYLIDQGCQINRQSIKGNTALHDCAESNNMEIMKLLIRNGATFKRDCFGLTPLMTSAINGNLELFEYLKSVFASNLSVEDQVDAYKLLGTTFVDKLYNLTKAFHYWQLALKLTPKCCKSYIESLTNTDKSYLEAYGNLQEYQTEDDLNKLYCDPDLMKLQSLIIRERILGIHHIETFYFIRFRGASYADAGDYAKCISLWMYNLEKQQKISKPLSETIRNSFSSMIELFILMLSKNNSGIRICDIYRVLKTAIVEILSSCNISSNYNKQGNVYQILDQKLDVKNVRCAAFKIDINDLDRQFLVVIQLIGFMCKLRHKMTREEWHDFKKTVFEFLSYEPRSTCSYSLLHILCILSSGDQFFSNYELPLFEIFSLVVDVSTRNNLNIVDIYGNTPLHILFDRKELNTKMVSYLIKAGAHFDICNEMDLTPLDLVKGKPIENHYKMKFSSLKCMCAHLIAKNNIDYWNLPRDLRNFIMLHQRKNP